VKQYDQDPVRKEAHTREYLATPTDLKVEATRDISAALRGLLADVSTPEEGDGHCGVTPTLTTCPANLPS
jgi:hypothetical protein